MVELFKNAGFKNIESNPAKDLEAKESEKLNTVKSVFINKSKNFKEGDSVKDNCNIVIYYHAYKNIPYPYSAKDIEHTDVNVLIDALTDAGFVNIETKEVFDLDPDAINYKVKNTVYINGSSNYTKGDEFPLDCPIEITSHYPYDKYTLKLHISFIPNLFFNKYSVEVKKDGKELGVLSHGEDMDYVFREKPGKYTFTFKRYQYKSPQNEFTIDLRGNLDVTYRLSCYEDSIHLEQTQYFDESLVGENEIMLMCSESSFRYKDYKIVEDTIREFGFTNISTEILYDIVYGWTKEGEVDSVSFNGDRSYSKGAIFDKDVPIVITYHLKEQDNPSYIPVTASSESFVRKNSDEVYKAISEMGFTNINYSTYKYYDTPHSEKEVKSVTINGYSFKEGERFDPNARIVITYYIKGERSSTSSNSYSRPTPTPKPSVNSTETATVEKVDIGTVISLVRAGCADGLDYLEVVGDEKEITMKCGLNGLAEDITALKLQGYGSTYPQWVTVKKNMISMCKSCKDLIRQCGYNDTKFTVDIVNDTNTDRVLLSITDGYVIYDIMAE